jgi:hypothetical protein
MDINEESKTGPPISHNSQILYAADSVSAMMPNSSVSSGSVTDGKNGSLKFLLPSQMMTLEDSSASASGTSYFSFIPTPSFYHLIRRNDNS